MTWNPAFVITAAVFDTKPYDREALQQASADHRIEWHFLEFRLTQDTAYTAKNARAVCVFVNDQVDRPYLEVLAGQGVELVALRCTGFNNVNVGSAKELKITVTRVPVYSPHAVAEHAVALLLTLNRKIHRAFNRVRELNFSLNGLVGFDLYKKTAGIVGTGKIGRVTAQILRGFGMKVLAYDMFPNHEWAKQTGVEYVEAPSVLLRNSDVISLHTPLTPETGHTIRAETIELMKPGSILINLSRGALVDTKALIKGLKSGRLAGVGLDVYEEEEGIFFEDLSGGVLHDDELARLLTFPNVLITSHQAFLTDEALTEIARTTVANISASAGQESFVEGSVVTRAGLISVNLAGTHALQFTTSLEFPAFPALLQKSFPERQDSIANANLLASARAQSTAPCSQTAVALDGSQPVVASNRGRASPTEHPVLTVTLPSRKVTLCREKKSSIASRSTFSRSASQKGRAFS